MKKLRFCFTMLILSIFLLCFSGLSSAAGPTVYDDGFGPGWTSFVWGGTANTATTGNTPFKGTRYIKANFSQAWGGVTLAPSGGFNTAGFTNISLAVRNWQGGQGLYFYAVDQNNIRSSVIYLNNHADVWYFPGSQWKWVRVPIALLGLSNSNIKSISIETDSAAEIHFDEVRLESKVTLYEGVQGQRGPTNMFWNWGSSVNQQYQEAAYPGDDVLRSDFNQSWGGLQFEIHYHSVFWSSEYKYFTALVKTFDSGQNVYPYFIDADTGQVVLPAVRMADYLPGGAHTPGTWQNVLIPMSAFLSGRGGAPVRIGSVVFENAVSGTVLLDNVAVTNPIILKWPLGVNNPSRTISGYHFNVNWDIPGTDCPSGTWKLHTGVDYTAAVGDNVYAAEAGVVKHVHEHPPWKYHIVIEHITVSGQKYTTVYWHVIPVVGLGEFVGPIAKGQLIGTVANISTGAHLHFGVWLGDYATYGENGPAVGALPVNACSVYPAFPGGFVDPSDTRNVLFQ